MSRPDSATSSSSSSTSSCHATSSAQLRKIKKPMIERRRRERINVCLNQLKSLVLEALSKNESSYSKMEKADILEMTVAHLKSLQHHQLQNDPKVRGHESARGHEGATYISGFWECTNEVEKFLTTINPSDRPSAEVLSSLIRYLRARIEDVQKDVRHSSVQLHPVLDSSSFRPAESLTQFQTVPQSSEIMSQSTVTSGTTCFQVKDASAPVSATARTRHILGQLPYLQHPYVALTSNLPLSSQSHFATAATSTVARREHMQSPTQGDEFPKSHGIQFPKNSRILQFLRDCQISPGSGSSPSQTYCSKSENSAEFLSRSVYKVEPSSRLETMSSGPLLECLWRPW